MKRSIKIYLPLFLTVLILFLFYALKSLKKASVTFSGNGLYQTITQKESCTSCHQYKGGFTTNHNPEKIGCTSCHLGKPNETTKTKAHQGLVTIPGNLSNASETCSKCHQGIDYRIKNSPMNTMSGVVSIDKYVFGENNNLDSLYQIHHLKNNSPAATHLRNKCASCHLGNEKTKTEPITEKTRGGGCLACHLNYSDEAKRAFKTAHLPKIHASISLQVTDKHCFGCHSRSGRISTNYEGWHETQIHKDSIPNFNDYRLLEDQRVFIKKNADVHHNIGMSCIDCHDTWDVMGTGQQYAHQEQAVSTTCNACHNDNFESIAFNALNEADKRMIRNRNIDTTAHYLLANDKVYYNVIINANKATLISKNTHKSIPIQDDFTNCLRYDAHQAITCSACHTSWAPQCISCHTSFDSDMGSYDLLAKKEVDGQWLEKGEHYMADYPTLAVVQKKGNRIIKTVAPGMIMTLDQSQADSLKSASFHRLFAPVSAHTISKKTPDCKSCHLNPLVLGYGRGKLSLSSKGKWQFNPQFEKHQDGLPLDAWIAFGANDTIAKATRKNVRPFTKTEQAKILRVGACLTCHKQKSKVVKQMLRDFDKTLLNKNKACRY
jgi:hypothetical protein